MTFIKKYFNYYIALLRAFPCIIPTSSIFFSILFQQKIGLIFGIFFMIVDKFAGLSKIISYKRGIANCAGTGIVDNQEACKAEFNLILPSEIEKYNINKEI